MDHPQRAAHTESTNNGATNIMPNILFREIHKNAFLKRHSSDRRAGFPRKSEKVWVVFCVHDDAEAFLEIYPDQKLALTHKPEWFTSLTNTLHISPSICGHEDEFEFAVTLTSQVVRLAAPTWESMMEWVETIRNKLRELKVLSPKENIYSKMPEQRQPLLPTRDPNSPLPLPPEGPSTLLPGVEPVHLDTRNNEVTERSQRENRSNVNHRTRQETTESEVETNEPPVNKPRVRLNRAVSVPESPANVPSGSNITVIEVSSSNSRTSHSASECGYFNFTISDETHGEIEIEDVFTTPPLTPRPDISNGEAHYEHVFVVNNTNNTSEIKIKNENDSSHENNLPCTSSSLVEDEVNDNPEGNTNCISLQTQTKLEKVNIPGLIPRVPAKSKHDKRIRSVDTPITPKELLEVKKAEEEEKNKSGASSSAMPAYSQVQKTKIKIGESSKSSDQASHLVSPIPPRRRLNDNQSDNRPKPELPKVLENAKLKKSKQNNINKNEAPVSNNQYRNESSTPSTSGNSRINITKKEGVNNHNNNIDVEPLTATVQPAVGGVISVEDIPLIGGHQRRRRRSSSSDAGTASTTPPSRGIGGADRIRVNVPLTVALPLQQRNESDRRPSATETEVNTHVNLASQSSSRLTLREQQVLQLRREMTHPGGVRLQLRRKDCIGSIALVDVLSGVW